MAIAVSVVVAGVDVVPTVDISVLALDALVETIAVVVISACSVVTSLITDIGKQTFIQKHEKDMSVGMKCFIEILCRANYLISH